ncbi:Prophage endopeptidase tail [Bacillus sp. 491mf]|uniref:phage tail protein n=1 Tax=Bacillus sp. 491mf TaxID=1761755 RepID=UPI0008E9B3CF|nr:phage tail protein [Bacillus sp. 491mf]SFC03089.1 Prophage endopeptidase tail [Bacillus sp. 491mf]
MKRVERPKIEQLGTGEQYHLVDMKLFEVMEGKNEPSSIRFEVPDTDMNKRVYPYVEDRNILIFEGQYYILLVNKLNELGFKDCDAIQIGAELSRQTQEQKVTGDFSIEEGLDHIFQGSNFKYVNYCSPKKQLHFENFGGVNRMSMIQNLLKRFDIECIFDNMTVIFADRIGKTTDKLYKFGYNVNAIEKTTDDSECSFSVLLLGHTPSEEDGGGPQFKYYYESPLKYKMPELIRCRQAENIEDDKIKDKETALRRCKEFVNDIPIVSITVDHKEANFDDTNEPKVGDKAILQHHKYNMDFDVRVVKRRRYPFEQTPNVYEFSNKRDELVDRTEEQKKWTSDILSVVKDLDKKLLDESNNYTDRINAITDKKAEEAKQESEAAKKLAELVKENQKNFQTTIIESDIEPTTNLEPGKSLWLDTSKGKPGVLKKWSGTTWDVIVPDVEEAKAELNEKVEAVQKEANGKYNEVKETVDLVNRTMTDVQNEQGNVSKRMTTVEQTTEGFNRSIESLNKSNETITNKINTVEETADGIKENITKVESDQETFNQRITTVEKSAEGISQNVSEIKEVQTSQRKAIEQANSTIEQHSNALNLAVKIKDVENYVSGVGNANLIRNSRFTQGTKYWGIAAKFPAVVDQDTTYLGDFSMKLTVFGQTSPVYNSFTSNRIPIQAGEEVVVSAYFMTKNIDEHYNKKLRMVAVFWKSDGTQFSAGTHDFTISNDTWTRQEFTKVAPPEAASVGLRAYVLQNGTFWLAHPMLQKGNKASAYVENPNDIVDKDQILEDLAHKVATEDYNKKMTEIDRQIVANTEGIRISAKSTEVYTKVEADGKYATGAYVKTVEGRIDVTEKAITNTVRKGSVISEINQTAEAIKIEAKRINLVGAVTAESIAGKFLEGITIRAKDPNDNNNFTEMSNGRIFTQGFQTPAEWNQWSKKVITGLEKGSFYSRGYKEDGTQANSVNIAAWGLNLNNGNDGATYGAGSLIIRDNGQNKTVEARSYDATMGWRPSFKIDNPQGDELARISSNGIYFHNYNGRYENEWVTESNGSHLTLYRSMLACDDHWNGYLQVKSGNGSSHNGIVATEFKTTSQLKLKTNVKDIQIDALQDVLDLKIKEYYFKSDVSKLYEMREQKEEGQAPYTLNDINKYYGFMVDDCPISFTDVNRQGVNLYASLSVTIKGFQQYVGRTDERLNQIEKVIIDENNSKRRTLRKSGGRTTKRSQPREKHLFGSRNRTRSRKSKVTRRK